MLLSVDLEVALRGLRSRLPTRPPADASFPFDVEYADDTDLISSSCSILDEIGRVTSACLAEWSRRSVFRHADRIDEEWKMTLKLVSLPRDAEDRQFTHVAFRKLWTVWLKRPKISLQLRPRCYASFESPVLTYNMDLNEFRTGLSRHVPPSSPA